MESKEITIEGQSYVLIPLRSGCITMVSCHEIGGELKATIRTTGLPIEKRQYGPIIVEPEACRVEYGNNKYNLGPATFKALCYMAEHQDELITYDELAAACSVSNKRASVAGLVFRLKSDLQGIADGWIQNVTNSGYICRIA